jgi:hypothetical protein
MYLARRCFLYLITGTMLTAKCGVAIAQIVPMHSLAGYPQCGAADTIVRLIRQWAADRRDLSFIAGDRTVAKTHPATAIGTGQQSAASSTHLTVIRPKTALIDDLRSWARRKLVGDRISS